ncbi:MAG: DUF4197 domain-containing protein [Betaproteobacteria bacterium]|nr:DUF4197 domain-containing protein [Betaproteobacteria bacterium]
MTTRTLALVSAAILGWSNPAWAQLDKISNQDATSGLKAALEKGSQAAVTNLGKPDGFFGNGAVKIPLPDSLKRYEKLMRSVGMGKYADELILTMNRAAEAAVPEAKALLVDSVKKMTVQDAKGILTGGNTAGTEYFKRTTSEPLRGKFLPIVAQATKKVKLADKYNEYAAKGAKFGLVKKEDANLDSYVTQKALDGLFFMVAEEEKKIRENPVKAGSEILKKVFGALK